MTEMSKSQWKQFVAQWRAAGPELERIHRDEMRSRAFDAQAVDDVLRIGETFGRSRETSGLVELQRWLLKLAQFQGVLPQAAHEGRDEYGA
jgi:hypothetical protein